MTVECTQTAHQKETVKLIKDFFESADYDIPRATEWGNSIISRLYGITGIKFDKPFMAEVFEGSFTTNSLLKKYPIKASQIMYIFTMFEGGNRNYVAVATRVSHDGTIYTERGSRQDWSKEIYFNYKQVWAYYSLNDYNTCRKQAIKTLVLVTNQENVVEVDNRKCSEITEDNLINNILYNYEYNSSYKTHRVKFVEKKDWTCRITLVNGAGKIYEYHISRCLGHFDKSGYCVEPFRNSLSKRLYTYRSYLKLKRIVDTKFSQELQTIFDEVVVLKKLILTSAMNNMDSKTLRVLHDLMGRTVSIINSHETILSKLKKSKELYEECDYKTFSSCPHYSSIDSLIDTFEDMDFHIKYIRTRLFDDILQQDIA